jgi:hypothetical protein
MTFHTTDKHKQHQLANRIRSMRGFGMRATARASSGPLQFDRQASILLDLHPELQAQNLSGLQG